MWAAIRYRRAQAVALMLLSALLTACAVFAPVWEEFQQAEKERKAEKARATPVEPTVEVRP